MREIVVTRSSSRITVLSTLTGQQDQFLSSQAQRGIGVLLVLLRPQIPRRFAPRNDKTWIVGQRRLPQEPPASRVAAASVSPGREPWVSPAEWNKSHRDGTNHWISRDDTGRRATNPQTLRRRRPRPDRRRPRRTLPHFRRRLHPIRRIRQARHHARPHQ